MDWRELPAQDADPRFSHLQTLSVNFFDRRPLGDILSRLTGDLTAIETLVLSAVTDIVAQVVKIIVFAGVLCYLNWQLALASSLAVPVCWLIARFFSVRIKAASREVRWRSGSISTVVEESLGNAALIQVYGRRQAEISRFIEQSRGSVVAELAASRLRAVFSSLTDLLEVAAVLAIIGMGVWELTNDRITLGGLLVFLVYLSQLYSLVRGLGQLSNTVYAAAASAERIIDLLETKPEIRTPAHPVRLRRPQGELSVDRVSFHYPDTAANALSDISFTVPAGRSIALVGGSGAGKTTLTKLLLRLHDPATGAIRLDGIDIRNFDPDQLRATMAVVLQETLLLDGTIVDNILAGRPDATEHEVVAAAVAADAHEFITALPEGYRTRVGQRGRLLSGGATPAHCDRTGDDPRRARVDSRRTHHRPRCESRCTTAGPVAPSYDRAHHHRDLAPPDHGHRRRSDHLPRPRPHHRDRHPLSTAGP
jgi:ATP-binding cassette, subfamily B, bacterial